MQAEQPSDHHGHAGHSPGQGAGDVGGVEKTLKDRGPFAPQARREPSAVQTWDRYGGASRVENNLPTPRRVG